MVYLLQGSLNGLKQCGHQWLEKLDSELKKITNGIV